MTYFKASLFVVAICLVFTIGCGPSSNMDAKNTNKRQIRETEKREMNEVSGKLDVNITIEETDDPKLGMMLLDKKYLGPLSAIGKGRMLTGMTEVKNSAGYVAIEKVSGTLEGPDKKMLKGTFVIQHFGIQKGEAKTLKIEIIPDSGTEELTGIEGTMEIEITDSGHTYRLNYWLPSE